MYESFKTVQNSSDRFAHGAVADSDARNERIRFQNFCVILEEVSNRLIINNLGK